MRSISATLEAEQKKPTRKPVVKVEVQAYGHPLKSSSIQWGLFGWEKLYSGSETKDSHGVAIPGDGSLNRIRKQGTNLYHQRVTSPDENSNYSNWGGVFGGVTANAKAAIAAHGAEVIVVSMSAAYLYRIESANNGATWGSWIEMSNARPCERGVAIAYKSNGDCAIVHASDVNDPTSLYIQTRTGGGWSAGLGQRAGTWEIEALTMYHDGDWNIIALVTEGSYLSVVKMIYGDGDQVAAGTWGTDRKIGLGRARIDIAAQMALRRFESQWRYGGTARHAPTYWEKHQAVVEALAGETLDVSGPFLVKPPSYPALLSLARQNEPWIFRLKPGTEFNEFQWSKADTINTLASWGLALACDATHIWATQPNQVWRSPLPSLWSAPTAGSGAGSKITLPISKISRISESIDPEQQSELEVELNNSEGTYDSPGSGAIAVIKRGARVNLHIGYRTWSADVPPVPSDETSECGRYFIESLEYNRSPNQSLFTIHCVDAWGLLQRFAMNKPVDWNLQTNDYNVAQLIQLLLGSVGATLDYTNASGYMTNLYPRLEVHAGETAANIIAQLLSLVPDVIFFMGLSAKIVYPQTGDTSDYTYSAGGEHAIVDGRYITETKEINRAFAIGRDKDGFLVYGTALRQADIDLVGERLDFKLDLSIPTTSKANDTAESMLRKMRLTKQRGFVLIPPNCGQELWDVITITDKPCAQDASIYRIIGMQIDYEPHQARYQHRLILGAV